MHRVFLFEHDFKDLADGQDFKIRIIEFNKSQFRQDPVHPENP
jgi:hypothetical protein